MNKEVETEVVEHAADHAVAVLSPQVRLPQIAEKAIEETALPDKQLDVINIDMRKCFVEAYMLNSAGDMDGDDVNLGGTCLFCIETFSGPWNDQSGCICQLCKVLQVWQ